jgi:aminoglycoside 6'-N-acetyltransferase
VDESGTGSANSFSGLLAAFLALFPAGFEPMTTALRFQRLTANDLPLLHEWLQREPVRAWWSRRESFDEVVDHYLPAIEGRKPTDLYLIVLEERPVGFIQTYLLSDHPDSAELVGAGTGVAGVDLFIAEAELTGQGLGAEVLRSFTRQIVFARPTTIAWLADPDARNAVSLRAFEKAGFHKVNDFLDPNDGATHTLMRLERPV